MDVPTFDDLEAALAFLAAAIDRSDYGSIADACSAQAGDARWQELGTKLGLPSRREYRLTAIHVLAEHHRQTPLLELYAGRSFPRVEREFTLGGHGKELGHLHIDFTREEGGWTLKELWVCR